MTDYTEMTNEEINRAVAERLGYTMCVDAPHDYDYVLMGIGGEFTEDWLVAANIDEAWEIVWGKDEDSVLSDYARDLNAAIGLFDGTPYKVFLERSFEGAWDVEVYLQYGGIKGHADKVQADDLAAAICRAWLAATE